MKKYKINNVEVDESQIREIIRNNPELLKEESKGKYFEPKRGDLVWVNFFGNILDARVGNHGMSIYDTVYVMQNVIRVSDIETYRTKEEAELARDKQRALVRLWKWADKNAYFRPDWNKSDYKFYPFMAYYTNSQREIRVTSDTNMQRNFLLPYFESAAACNKFISDNKADLETVFLK